MSQGGDDLFKFVGIVILGLAVIYIAVMAFLTVSMIAISIGAIYAFAVSVYCFFKSLVQNINPYTTYVDKHPHVKKGMKRNYCFGPGFHQIAQTIKGAFQNLAHHCSVLTAWKDNWLNNNFFDVFVYIGYISAMLFAVVFGVMWLAVFSVILTLIITVGISLFFPFFTLLWLTDLFVLWLKSIHSRCPHCKSKSLIPVFACPTCGVQHEKLVPNPYGVLQHQCTCGTNLATTFIGGRSQYEAYCPFCHSKLLASDSQQYGLQLVGGTGSGKTTFLAAFWHEYKEKLKQCTDIAYKVYPTDAFDKLETWFQTGKAEATSERNANMYNIFHTIEQETTVQMAIYDIAGETFDFGKSDVQQQQFRYCEGFLVVIDPTKKSNDVSATIGNFINSFDEISGKHAADMVSIPVAVMITKADLYEKEIGLSHINALFQSQSMSSSEEQQTIEQCQDNICRNFLMKNDFSNVVNLIDAKFSNIRYFPVSAMGHSIENTQYKPWGVIEPVFWLMSHDNCPLRHSMGAYRK